MGKSCLPPPADYCRFCLVLMGMANRQALSERTN